MTRGARLEQIQIMRGVAASLVFLFHLGVTVDRYTPAEIRPWVSIGNIGVDLFFVISGFVMCWSVRDLSGPSDARTFLGRRLWRIAPLLYIVSFVHIALTLLRGGSIDLARVVNCFTIMPVMASPDPFQYALVQAWTLGFELAFYLLVAAVVAARVRWRLAALTLALVALPLLPGDGARPFVSGLMVEFAFGVVAFGLWSRNWTLPPWFLAAGAVAAFFLPLTDDRFIAYGLPSALAFMAALGWNPSGAAARVGTWLGEISYSMYLVHVVVFATLAPLLALVFGPLALAVALGALGLAVSWMLYESVEAPLTRVRLPSGAGAKPLTAA